MTQMASVIAVATVFIGLWTLIPISYSQRRGAYTRDDKDIEVKVQGGVIVGFYGVYATYAQLHGLCSLGVI